MLKVYPPSVELYSWTEGMGQFMERMNFKAAQIGMSSSNFVNPYGGSAFGYNTTNCMDILKLGIYAYSYPYVMDVMTSKGIVDFHIYGENDRDVHLPVDFQKDFDDNYNMVHPGETNPHTIYGGKGGGWSSGEHKVFAYLAYCNVAGRDIVCVAANVSADRSVGRIYRKNAIIELCDICEKVLKRESTEGMSVTYADYAAAALLPEHTLSVMLKKRPIETLYAQSEEMPFNPASISKVLMAITVMDICGSNQEMYRIEECDICNDSGYWAFVGDIESIETGMYPVLINSNGSNTMAMARYCGEKILAEKARFGLK